MVGDFTKTGLEFVLAGGGSKQRYVVREILLISAAPVAVADDTRLSPRPFAVRCAALSLIHS